jgi:hypothetical protein
MADLELDTDFLARDLTYNEVVELLDHGPGQGVNVKWFRAKGDGSTDDAAAIQRAVDWNSVTVVTTATTAVDGTTLTFGANLTAAKRAIIDAGTAEIVAVFNLTNPGSIVLGQVVSTTATSVTVNAGCVDIQVEIGDSVNSPVTFDHHNELSINFKGCGDESWLYADIDNDAVLSRSTGATSSGVRVIEKLKITNIGLNGKCIEINGTVGGVIRDCQLIGTYGTFANTGGGPLLVQNVVYQGFSAGRGATHNGIVTFVGCDFTGWVEAIRHWQGGLSVLGCRFEVNSCGIMEGKDDGGNDDPATNICVIGGTWESNLVGIDFNSSLGGFVSINLTASAGAAPGSVDPQRGLYCHGAGLTTFAGCQASGPYSVSAFDTDSSGTNNTFINCSATNSGSGVAWEFPTNIATIQLINCNTQPTGTVANLPALSDAFYAGRVLIVTNATTTTWSATAAVVGGGSNTVPVTPRNVAGTWTWTLA